MSVITRTSAPASLEPSEEIVTALEPSGIVEPGRELSAQDPDLGASTVEYAIILLAAAAFGGVMAAVLASNAVSDLLLKIVEKALAI